MLVRESIQILISTCISRSHPCCSLYCILSVMTYVSHLLNSPERKCRQCCQVYVNFKLSLFNIFWWFSSPVHDIYDIQEMELNHDEFPEDDEICTFLPHNDENVRNSRLRCCHSSCANNGWGGMEQKVRGTNSNIYVWLIVDFEGFFCAQKEKRFIKDNRSNFTRILAPISDFFIPTHSRISQKRVEILWLSC